MFLASGELQGNCNQRSTELAALRLLAGPVAGFFSARWLLIKMLLEGRNLSFQRKSR